MCGGLALDAAGLVVAAVASDVAGSVPLTALGLFVYGAGVGAWDVATNVEGAEVERRVGRTRMPRFDAGFSVGTVAGALVGVIVVRLDLALAVHLPVLALAAVPVVVWASARFLPTAAADDPARSWPGSVWSRRSGTPPSWQGCRCSGRWATASVPSPRSNWWRC